MNLVLLTPTRTLVEVEVSRVTAEAENGSFCLLPRHIDFVAGLVPGLLSYIETGEETIRYAAIDEGILVKCGDDVLVSVRRASCGADLEALERTVAEEFRQLDEHERIARSAMARLEAGALRRFGQLGKEGHG